MKMLHFQQESQSGIINNDAINPVYITWKRKQLPSLKSAQLCAQFENTCLNLNISHCTKTRDRLLVTQRHGLQ